MAKIANSSRWDEYPLSYYSWIIPGLQVARDPHIERGGAPHFWLDYMTYSDCKIVRRRLADRGP